MLLGQRRPQAAQKWRGRKAYGHLGSGLEVCSKQGYMHVYVYVSVLMYMYIYMYVCIYIYTHVGTYINVYVYMFICLFTCVYKNVQTSTHTYILMYISIWRRVLIYIAYVHVYLCVCMYVRICLGSSFGGGPCEAAAQRRNKVGLQLRGTKVVEHSLRLEALCAYLCSLLYTHI